MTDQPLTDPASLLAALRDRLAPMADQLDAWPDEALEAHGDDWRALAAHLAALDGLLVDVRAARDTLARRMAPIVKRVPKRTRQIPVPGIGIVDVQPSTTTHRYDAARLISVAAELVARDPDTGYPLGTAAAVREFARLAGCDAPSFSGWRAGVAEEYHLPLVNYRDTTRGEPKAVIR